MTGAADLIWDTLISNQVWNFDDFEPDILMDLKLLWPQGALVFFKEVFKFLNFKSSSFCVLHLFHHYIQYELLLENYFKSLQVY